MYTFFIGDDSKKAKSRLEMELEKQGKEEALHIHRITDAGFDPSAARLALYNQSLFGGTEIVILSHLLDHPDGESFYLSLSESPNIVYVLEGTPKKDLLNHFRRRGEIVECVPQKKSTHSPIGFALSDAISQRDKKRAWGTLRQAKQAGLSGEELHGTIFWGTKMLFLAGTLPREEAEAAGVSRANYGKYHEWSKKFLSSEIEDRLRHLRDMYHLAHRGDGDIDDLLEKYVLGI